MENYIYKASVTTENQTEFYLGSTGITFKIYIQNTNTASSMKNTVMRQLCRNTYGS